jgi:hypothetical protein
VLSRDDGHAPELILSIRKRLERWLYVLAIAHEGDCDEHHHIGHTAMRKIMYGVESLTFEPQHGRHWAEMRLWQKYNADRKKYGYPELLSWPKYSTRS